AAGQSEVRYGLFAQLQSIGIDTRSLIAMDLISRDETVVRIEKRELAVAGPSLEIFAPPRRHGELMVQQGATGAQATATAIALYRDARPSARAIRRAQMGSNVPFATSEVPSAE